MTITEFLHTRVPFLHGLTKEQAHALAVQVIQTRYSKGQAAIMRGTTVEGLHVVATGKVGVWAKLEKGGSLQKVDEMGPGDVFGETSIIEMGTALSTVKATEDATLIFVIPQDAFRKILTQNAEFQARATALVTARKKLY